MKNMQMLLGFSKFCFHTPYLMTQCTSSYSPPPGFQTPLLVSLSGLGVGWGCVCCTVASCLVMGRTGLLHNQAHMARRRTLQKGFNVCTRRSQVPEALRSEDV